MSNTRNDPSQGEAPALATVGGVLAPDTSLYTMFRPTSLKSSYATWDAIPFTIGGLQSFSYNLLFRLRSFGTDPSSGYVARQSILRLNGRDGLAAGVFVRYVPDDGFVLEVFYQGGSLAAAHALQADRWYDVTFTWDGAHATVYLDGALAGSLPPASAQISWPSLAVGLDETDPPAQSGDGPFIGDLKRLMLWLSCLSDAEAAQQMWTVPAEPVQKGNLLLGYDFTAIPAAPVGDDRNLRAVNTGLASDAPALFSPGGEVASPGEGTTANPGAGAPFSVLAWIYLGTHTEPQPPLNGYILGNGDRAEPSHFGVALSNGTLVVELGGQSVRSRTELVTYQWYYLGVTYDGATCSIYLNGALDTSAPVAGSASPSAGTLRLWGILSGGQPSATWSGSIQFLSIWKTALTATQVAQQAREDPTLDADCTANFMLSSQPFVDSVAVERYGLWDADQLLPSATMRVQDVVQYWSTQGRAPAEPRRAGRHRVSAVPRGTAAPAPPRTRRPAPGAAHPFSAAHRERMVAEFAAALTAVPAGEHADRWLARYRAEVDRVFDLAAASPDRREGRRVSYRAVDGEFAMFYHPDAQTEIDLGVRVPITQECTVWWATFILSAILGLLGVFGIPTPVDDLKDLAQRIATDPVVVQTLTSVVGLTFTAGTLISFCRVLYDFGYLSQALWLALEELSWWGASKFIVYVVGVLAPAASPQKALFISECITTVADLTLQLVDYPAACGSSAPALAAA